MKHYITNEDALFGVVINGPFDRKLSLVDAVVYNNIFVDVH